MHAGILEHTDIHDRLDRQADRQVRPDRIYLNFACPSKSCHEWKIAQVAIAACIQ